MKCKICRGERGIHRYGDFACPVGGREAPIDKKQEWKETRYQPDKSEEVFTLRNKSDEIRKNLKSCGLNDALILDLLNLINNIIDELNRT